jgi:preprotein translocase subunit YajC
MSIGWLFLLLVLFLGFAFLAMMDMRSNREKKERKETIERLKQEAIGFPEKLNEIETLEIELDLNDKITDKIEDILRSEVSDDLYKGAFNKNRKPDIGELSKCIMDYGYQPDMFNEKVSNMIKKLACDPDFAFLLKHGVHKEAQIRHQLKIKKLSE